MFNVYRAIITFYSLGYNPFLLLLCGQAQSARYSCILHIQELAVLALRVCFGK